jgi:hypothetical protein
VILLSKDQLEMQFKGLVELLLTQSRSIGEWDQYSITTFLNTTTAIQTFVAANFSGFGECREELPYAPLKPVLRNGEIVWCCEHDPEHCAK